MYKVDLGGTNLRVFKDNTEIYTQKFNGNINLNPNLGPELVEVLHTIKVTDKLLIGIAGYYSCQEQLKLMLCAEFDQHLTNYKVVSDAEFHAMNLITSEQLLVSLGTGSVGSYYQQEEFKLIGGYGHQLGDIGSGYHFGKLVIQTYLHDYEAANRLPYMELVETHFKQVGRGILTSVLGSEKASCSQLAKLFMDDWRFEAIFELFFKQFEIELNRMIAISCKPQIVINGAVTNSEKFVEKITKLPQDIIIKN